MNTISRIGIALLAALALLGPVTADESDLRGELQPAKIDIVRINLPPAGAALGFESVVQGSDTRILALIDLIRDAEPGGGHKCPNTGTVRFHMLDGTVIGIGLLPGHTEGLFGFRLYDGERLIGPFLVDRTALLAAFTDLGVPTGDPAFRR